eukprot:scaffold1353_cov363-Pavlova_lutheri.AAC.7
MARLSERGILHLPLADIHVWLVLPAYAPTGKGIATFLQCWFFIKVMERCMLSYVFNLAKRYVHEGGRHPSVGLQAHVSRSMTWCTCRMVPVSQVRVRCSQDFFAQLGFQVVQEQLLAVCSIPGLFHGRAHKPSAPRLDRERARAIFQSTWRAGKCIFTSPHILSPIPPGSGRGSVKALLCETRGPSRGP